MRRLRCGPEIGNRKARFEVGAEIVHPAYGEHDVHAKLRWVVSVGLMKAEEGRGEEGEWERYFKDFEVCTTHLGGLSARVKRCEGLKRMG